MKKFIAVCCLFSVIACSSYDVSVNDNVVYSPKPLFSDYALTDSALGNCIKQTIIDQKVTQVSGLKRLRCTHAGITDLSGISRFYDLEELDLSDNTIGNIAPLANLGRLKTLILENNQLIDTAPLLPLIKLTDVRLQGNEGAQCENLAQLSIDVHANGGSIVMPEHCSK